jgi:hemerythrin
MDSALSAWINKRLHGGAPVVLRRNLSAAMAADAKSLALSG